MLLPLLLACARPVPAPAAAASESTWVSPELGRLQAAIAADGDRAWQRLARLCDDVGARPSGSRAYARAVEWAAAELRADGLPRVWTEPVVEPRWVRGAERLTMIAPREQELAVLGLGPTVGTPGIEAPVSVVHRLDELGPQVAGTIVVINQPMPGTVPTIEGYGATVEIRWEGARLAARHGAVAALVRSVTPRSLYTPHTGSVGVFAGERNLPAAAITPEDADHLDRLVSRGVPVRLRLELGARMEGEVPSANVLAELPGAEKPEEVVLIGAHLDSWDVGQGAHDDGAGVVEVIEAMRHLHALGVAPRRTIRAVLFANEEMGLSGGKAYAAAHGEDQHVVAMETDLGGGAPRAWGLSGSPDQERWVRSWVIPLGLPIVEDGGGADISPLEDRGVVMVGYYPDDTHYFDVHHTRADTVDKVDPDALRASVGQVAAFTWQAANAP